MNNEIDEISEYEDFLDETFKDEVGTEKVRKLYLYEVINSFDKGLVDIFGTAATTVMFISNIATARESNDWSLSLDENTNYYIETFLDDVVEPQLNANTLNLDASVSIKNTKGLKGFTENYNDIEKHQLIICTLDDPLSVDNFHNGQQEVYLFSSIIPELQEKEGDIIIQENYNEAEVDKGVDKTNIELIDMVTFTGAIGSLPTKLVDLGADYVDYKNGVNMSEIGIEVPKSALIGNIYAHTLDDDGNNHKVEVLSKKDYPFINAAPIETEGSTQMYFRWFDYHNTLPLYVAKKFMSGAPVKALFKLDDGTWLQDGKELYELLKQMIGYSYMFINNFAIVYDKISNVINDTSSSAYGQLNQNIRIGYDTNHTEVDTTGITSSLSFTNKSLFTLTGQEPARFINQLYEGFLQQNHSLDKSTVTIFKSAIVALSRYIVCDNLALSGGINPFNQVYCPYYLKFQGDIAFTLVGNGPFDYYIETLPEVILESYWFDLDESNREIIPNNTFKDLSKLPLIRSEFNFIPAVIPQVLEPVVVNSVAAAVNPSGTSDLSYMWRLPFTDTTILNNIFLSDINSVPITGEVTINLGNEDYDPSWGLNLEPKIDRLDYIFEDVYREVLKNGVYVSTNQELKEFVKDPYSLMFKPILDKGIKKEDIKNFNTGTASIDTELNKLLNWWKEDKFPFSIRNENGNQFELYIQRGSPSWLDWDGPPILLYQNLVTSESREINLSKDFRTWNPIFKTRGGADIYPPWVIYQELSQDSFNALVNKLLIDRGVPIVKQPDWYTLFNYKFLTEYELPYDNKILFNTNILNDDWTGTSELTLEFEIVNDSDSSDAYDLTYDRRTYVDPGPHTIYLDRVFLKDVDKTQLNINYPNNKYEIIVTGGTTGIIDLDTKELLYTKETWYSYIRSVFLNNNEAFEYENIQLDRLVDTKAESTQVHVLDTRFMFLNDFNLKLKDRKVHIKSINAANDFVVSHKIYIV